MTVAENIRQTINETFELYKNGAKKFYKLSLSFSIISSIFTAFVAAITSIIVLEILAIETYENANLIDKYFMNPTGMNGFLNICLALLTLNVGLYALFLIKQDSNNLDEDYNWNKFQSQISNQEWNLYFIFLGIILVVYGLLFQDVFKVSTDASGMYDDLNFYSAPTSKTKFLMWVDSIIDLIKTYLPYCCAMLLVLHHYEGKINLDAIKKYRNAIYSALILSFCINVISAEVINYIKLYFVELIKIPFVNELIPGAFTLVLILLLTAFFYLGFASFIAYPFKRIFKAQAYPKQSNKN